MKTISPLERIFDAIQKEDKEELLNIVKELNGTEVKEMAKIIPSIRSGNLFVHQGTEVVYTHDQEDISVEELKEIEEKYAERAKTPSSEFIQYRGADQFYEVIMKDKKEKGWKFKDEE